MKNKAFFILIILCGILPATAFAQLKTGLVGILFDDTGFQRMSSIWYQRSADSESSAWPEKNDFSMKCYGYIKAPATAEITFYGEADNGMQLMIDDERVIDLWDGADQAKGIISMKKDKLYPVTIFYRQVSGSSFMKVYWSWEGHPKSIIPSSSIFYDEKLEKKVLGEFRKGQNIDLSALEFDVASIITLNRPEDVLARRKAFIRFLWGDNGFPSEKLPSEVVQDIKDPDFSSLENLKRIDRLVVSMEYGLKSIAYHFIPQKGNGAAAIYHQGHRGKFALGLRTINAFLREGYDVYAFSMPLLGMNNQPVVMLRRFGKMLIRTHQQMAFLNPYQGHPIKYFMEPVATVVNYMERFHYDRLVMVGISGGGWTTTLYAAIDPRIDISFPVAGSLPQYLRSRDLVKNGTLGDYEQQVPALYRIANYLELYIMGSFGEGRSQLQILNEFDACCFGGTGYTTYEDIVKEKVKSMGRGSYDVFLDSTHNQHQISPKALEVMSEYLKNH